MLLRKVIILQYTILHQIREGVDSLNAKNSFVWAQLVWAKYSCASMSVYIACHRDIPFAEQHQVSHQDSSNSTKFV